MVDFEQLGVFYLGRRYDLEGKKATQDLVLYDSKDLTTHAVCVGMTGSGKTGLCLALLEEAAIDGIPAIIIDPKGDLGNLLLTFPELRGEDFQPWLEQAEAARQGLSLEELAAKTAETWKAGLAEWGQQPERIQRFREAADVAIYTPGSSAGLPLSVLRSFSAPPAAVRNNAESLRERITASVSGLLALLGVTGDPLRSREHILLANILDEAWRAGRDLDMGALIREIQSPPFEKVGFVDLESFFPATERFDLAMKLNGLLASPGFSAWMEGEPLDIKRLLHTESGKPRLSILSIAHLSDAERMFFVTILLGEVIAWMRSQPGTSSLRALLYMDEVFGYFPPTANPPSKLPMLTLMKQARAFGLGVVLATQNPVDLDYKGLSNAGTWFLGRLQTERDKARVLDGLEGASAAAGAQFDRRRTETILSGLGSRVFLMNNVHEDEPVVFQTRWVLSYLRGPMTRDQIGTLMAERKQAAVATATGTSAKLAAPVLEGAAAARPMLPPDVPEVFLPRRRKVDAGSRLVYRPAVLGAARLHFSRSTAGVDVSEAVWSLLPAAGADLKAFWEDAEFSTDAEPELETEPEAGAGFESLPGEFTQSKSYSSLGTGLRDHLYRNRRLTVWKAPALKQHSNPGESEGDFRVRLSQEAHAHRDEQIEKLRAKYASKLATLQERIRKAEQRVEKEKSQASHQMLQTAISFGSSILGALFGRKIASSANVTRAATSVRSASRIAREREDVGQAQETVEALQTQFKDLETELTAEVEKIRDATNPTNIALEEVPIAPKKTDITVTRTALAWEPWVIDATGRAERAY